MLHSMNVRLNNKARSDLDHLQSETRPLLASPALEVRLCHVTNDICLQHGFSAHDCSYLSAALRLE
jgi:hypothetical protein